VAASTYIWKARNAGKIGGFKLFYAHVWVDLLALSRQKQAQETVLQLNRDFPTQNMLSGGGKRHLDTPAPLEGPG